jgi:hypothetical protein
MLMITFEHFLCLPAIYNIFSSIISLVFDKQLQITFGGQSFINIKKPSYSSTVQPTQPTYIPSQASVYYKNYHKCDVIPAKFICKKTGNMATGLEYSMGP